VVQTLFTFFQRHWFYPFTRSFPFVATFYKDKGFTNRLKLHIVISFS